MPKKINKLANTLKSFSESSSSESTTSEEISIYKTSHLLNFQINEIVEIYVECFNQAPWHENWDYEKVKFLLSKLNRTEHVTFLAYKNARICGFGITTALRNFNEQNQIASMGASENSIWILELGTAPKHRNKGICLKIVEAINDYAAANQYDAICLRTKTNYLVMHKIMKKLKFSSIGNYTTCTGDKYSLRTVWQKSTNLNKSARLLANDV